MPPDQHTVDPGEPLILPDAPETTDDEALHSLVKSIEGSVKGDIKWGAPTYKFVLHVIYLATASDTQYTLNDITEILDDDMQFHHFCAEEDATQFPETLGSPPTVQFDRVRRDIVRQFRTIGEPD